MAKYDKLVEILFETRSNFKLAKTLYPGWKDLRDYQYTHCVYINGPTKFPIIGYLTNCLDENEQMGISKDFVQFLKKLKPISFYDCLFVVDVYHLSNFSHKYPGKSIKDFRIPKFNRIELVDEILQISQGLLIWHYQLEKLLGVCIPNLSKVYELRKDLNAKKAKAWERIKSLMLFDEISLYDVISKRMAFGITTFPNMAGAFALYKFMK